MKSDIMIKLDFWKVFKGLNMVQICVSNIKDILASEFNLKIQNVNIKFKSLFSIVFIIDKIEIDFCMNFIDLSPLENMNNWQMTVDTIFSNCMKIRRILVCL